MPIFIIAVVAIIFVVIAGILLAKGTSRFDEAVQRNQEMIDRPSSRYNLALTQGLKIPVEADYETQIKEARILAAKQAAALPRGGNMGIGRLDNANELKTAWKGVAKDPITAVKIAAHHGWDGLSTGAVTAAPAPAAAPTAPTTPAETVELIPGKDYPIIEISDDMSPAEKRKARIANAKAKSAAKKAAKTAGTAPAASAAAAATATSAPAATAVTANIPEPTFIEITDDMSPDDKRKARIANSKAKSAYKKALKAAGVDPQAAAATTPPPPPAVSAAAAAPAAIPPPDLIELSDAMSPEEKRAARIANSKAKSAYKKALKAAGIDPKTVQI